MARFYQWDDEWQVWLSGRCCHTETVVFLTDKSLKNGFNPLRQVRKAGTPTLTRTGIAH